MLRTEHPESSRLLMGNILPLLNMMGKRQLRWESGGMDHEVKSDTLDDGHHLFDESGLLRRQAGRA